MSILFSIIIPCYNQAAYLSECLDSLLEQSYENWEAIIVNDGSTDNTNEIATLYCRKDDKIKLFQKQNGGLSSARNYGIQHAQGERIIFLDADDVFYSNCLSEVVKKLSKMNDDTLIQYGYSYFKENIKKPFHTVSPVVQHTLIPAILFANLGPCHSICISKKLVEQAGYFDENLKSLEDWDYWIRAAKCDAKLSIINKPLVKYRYVKNSMSRNAFVMFESFKTVLQRAISIDPRIKSESPLNKNYSIDCTKTINNNLIRMLGVSIMQKKVDESVEFFKKNTTNTIQNQQPKDFEAMCSYLTFRYWNSKEDVKGVLENVQPMFKEFFKKLGYNNLFIKKANYYIFKSHLNHYNIYQYGKIVGSCINYLNKKMCQN